MKIVLISIFIKIITLIVLITVLYKISIIGSNLPTIEKYVVGDASSPTSSQDMTLLISAAKVTKNTALSSINALSVSPSADNIENAIVKLNIAYNTVKTAYATFKTVNYILKGEIPTGTIVLPETPALPEIANLPIEVQANAVEEIARTARQLSAIAAERAINAADVLTNANALSNDNELRPDIIAAAQAASSSASTSQRTADELAKRAAELATTYRAVSDSSDQKCETEKQNIFNAETGIIQDNLSLIKLPQELISAISSLIYSMK